MKYTVVKIEEDLDFGCEERTPGSPVMAVLMLRDQGGDETVIRYPDHELYELGIAEGDTVEYESGKRIKKEDNMSGSQVSRRSQSKRRKR